MHRSGVVYSTMSAHTFGNATGPLLLPGATAARDVVYGYTSWGFTSPNATAECGAIGDLDFCANVAALLDFIRPFLAAAAPAGAATSTAGRRMLRAAQETMATWLG